MSTPLLTSGDDSRVDVIKYLNEQLNEKARELEATRAELADVRRENAKALAGIRRVLDPLYKALCVLYGEMEPIGGISVADAPQDNREKWDYIKRNLPPRLQQAIDLLLLQGSMKRTQIAAALKMDYSNCTKNVIGLLVRQGWVVDHGGSLSLKEL